MPSTLYRNGVVHSSSDPFAEALLVADGQIAWLGSEDTVHTVLDGADEVVDLDGALVTPGFVDAHVRLVETGLELEVVDLRAAGSSDVTAVLDVLGSHAAEARRSGATGPLLVRAGEPTAGAASRLPTREELDRATGGAPVLLTCEDGRAVVSSSFAEVAGCTALPGWSPDGAVTGEARLAAERAVRETTSGRRDDLAASALRAAAAAGIVAVHEHGAPGTDDPQDLARVLAMTRDAGSGLPHVSGFWAQLCETADDVRRLLDQVPGLAGVGAVVDGALVQRRAALLRPYTAARPDAHAGAAEVGDLLATAEQVANHVAAVTRAGSRAVLHAWGDRALAEVLLGIRAAADVEGGHGVRAAGHRLEHVPMVDAQALAMMVLLGLSAGLQPARPAGPGATTADAVRLLGPGRAAALEPLADLAGAGVPLCFGSAAPQEPFDPWGTVLAAVAHPEPSERISARAAFRAHTRGGWRAAGLMGTGAGEIRLGAPASLAIWHADALTVQAPDGRLAAWSTDPRAGTPLLPELGEDLPRPVCVRTLRDGVVLHDALS